mmetsp:Transcript_11855/g.23997  ORF Transcript_11855/g.23997 Transcript_11855/m.23997 type:complete len:187 (+) Transcript_11855:1078-1638(+)
MRGDPALIEEPSPPGVPDRRLPLPLLLSKDESRFDAFGCLPFSALLPPFLSSAPIASIIGLEALAAAAAAAAACGDDGEDSGEDATGDETVDAVDGDAITGRFRSDVVDAGEEAAGAGGEGATADAVDGDAKGVGDGGGRCVRELDTDRSIELPFPLPRSRLKLLPPASLPPATNPGGGLCFGLES